MTNVINARVVIGVTGHRKLENPESLRPRVRLCLEEIRRTLPALSNTPYSFCVLSPLADGADRLVATELLKEKDVHMEVVLPLPRERYIGTFLTPDSVHEFDRLLEKARVVRQPYVADQPEAAYVWVGRHVVEQCDVLIAVWDGDTSAGRGGTGEIVAHARHLGCPICWIDPRHGDFLQVEWGQGLDQHRYHALDEYNRQSSGAAPERRSEGPLARLRNYAARTSHDLPGLGAAEVVSPHFEKADRLALLYQRLHYRAGTWIYALAAAAVVIVATQTLFFHHGFIGVALELSCMATILTLIYFGKRQRWHSHWTEYRYLAERLRSMLYMSACGLEVSAEARSRGTLRHQWMSAAVASLTASLPAIPRPPDDRFVYIRNFLAEAWFDDQIAYHRHRSIKNERQHDRLERIGVSLFFVTFLGSATSLLTFIPAVHATLAHTLGEEYLASLQNLLAWISFSAPASGGAVAAINHHREFRKLSHRSHEMVAHLEDITRRFRDAQSWSEAGLVLTEAEELLSGENVEWLTNVRFHSLDSPA